MAGTTHTEQPSNLDTSILRCLPVELHILWFRYLSQPALLRVSALSKFWRALVLKDPGFYLSVYLRAIRGRHKRFLRHLDYARAHQRPIAIYFDFPFPPSLASRDLLSNKLSPAIERSMHLVRRISIRTGAPVSAAEVAFLAAPAPLLRDFVYTIDTSWALDEEEYDSYSNSESEFDGHDYGTGDINPYVRLPLVDPLFSHCAPLLSSVTLCGADLPVQPVAAFSNVTHVELNAMGSFLSIGVAAHFPAVQHFTLKTRHNEYPALKACTGASWSRMSLISLDLHDSTRVLRELLRLRDAARARHLKINFNAHYRYEDLPGYWTMRSKAEERRDFQARDADWAACLAHLEEPTTLEIYSTSRDDSGAPKDVHATVRSASDARSVTFYADDYVFRDERRCGRHYDPLCGLAPLCAVLTEVTLDQAHLLAIFRISKSLPALRLLHVLISSRAMSFWNCDTSGICAFDIDILPSPVEGILDLPALECIVLSNALGGASISSHELFHFEHAIGISSRRPHERPTFVLRGVEVVNGERHAKLLAPW